MPSTPRVKLSDEAEAAISVIRALVTSQKEPSTVKSILRDYQQLEGNALPYKKCGFQSADELLLASDEFLLHRGEFGEMRIFAKPKKNSAHIMRLVAAQKTSGSKKSGFAVMRKPQQSGGGGQANGGTKGHWNRTPKYSNPSGSQQQPFQGRPITKRGNEKGKGGGNASNVSSAASSPEANNNSNGVKNLNVNAQPKGTSTKNALPSNDLRHKLNAADKGGNRSTVDNRNRINATVASQNAPMKVAPLKFSDEPVLRRPQQKLSILPSPVASETVLPMTKSVNNRLQLQADPPATVPSRPVVDKPALIELALRPLTIDVSRPPPPIAPLTMPSIPGKKSVQDRLMLNQKVDSSDLEKVAKIATTPVTPPIPQTPETERAPPTVVPMVVDWEDPNATPVELLLQYCQLKNYPRPEYRYLRLKNKRCQGRVTVNGSTYSTYPEDHENEFACQFAAALNAIESIKRDEARNMFPVCLESDYQIAVKIYELLEDYSHGMFSKQIPQVFQDVHSVMLPENWLEIVFSYARMFLVEDTQVGGVIVFSKKQESDSSAASITSEAQLMLTNVLKLPWDEQYWNLYITNTVSTVEIWARLVGKDYSDKMDTLNTEIELSMLSVADAQQKRVKKASVGEYYLLCVTDCWYRVRAEAVNKDKGTCLCFFIDIGEMENVALGELYHCDPKYLELPGQSICFALDGLEDFNENRNAKNHLNNLTNGQVYIGEILTKREEYEREEPLKAILYDTSSDQDIVLNPIILKQICDDTPVPELNRRGVNNVMISYVGDRGEVFCLLEKNEMVYIQKLINNLVQAKALDGKHRGLYKTRNSEQLYLVQDDNDKKWYRASLDAEEPGPSCRMRYVDVGLKKSVNVSNIYRLELLSVALSRYPAQVIHTRMSEIPACSEQIVGRLRALLKPNMPAMVKVVSASPNGPQVKIFIHIGQNNILVCVNDTIRLETELETSSELISIPRSNAEPMQSSTVASKRPPKFVFPTVGKSFDIYVTIANNPSYFIVQPDTIRKQLDQLMVELQEYCGSKGQPAKGTDLVKGEFYAGKYVEDNMWYRVELVRIDRIPTHILVRYCDFGQYQTVDLDTLKILPDHLRELPQLAISTKLHGVKPKHDYWTKDDAIRFQLLTVGQRFVSFVKSIENDPMNKGEQVLEVDIIDVSTADDVLIRKVLVDEDRAIDCSASTPVATR